MYTRQSSRIRKGSKEKFQGSPSLNDDDVSFHHKGTKKKNRLLRKTKVDSGTNTDDESNCYILDIDTTQQKHVKKDEEWFARMHDEGLDLSDEDCGSVSSICSGPAALDSNISRKQRPSQGFCSACRNLYKKAKKLKEINNPDNGEWSHRWRKRTTGFPSNMSVRRFVMFLTDPKSLTCDQWVLLKKRRPKRVPNATG